MADDLKVVVKAVLEADEAESAKRISSQLPSIASAINSQSSIKVGVEIDEAAVRAQAQGVSASLNKHLKTHHVDVEVEMRKGSLGKLRSELEGIGISRNMAASMTKGFSKMGIEVDKISGKWKGVEGKAGKILELTLQGTDALGRTVSYLNKYDDAGNEIEQTFIGITNNLKQQRQEVERLEKVQKRNRENNITYLAEQGRALDALEAIYKGESSAKGLIDDTHISEVKEKIDQIRTQMKSLEDQSDQLNASQRADIQKQIHDIDLLIKKYQNVEYAATALRTKSVQQVNKEQVGKLDEYEETLRASGMLTDEFKKKISALRGELEGAFSRDAIIKFLDSFDKLKSDVGAFEAQIRSADKLYSELARVEEKAAQLRTELNSIDPVATPELYSAKSEEYDNVAYRQKLLQNEAQQYANILPYVQKYEEYLYRSANASAKMASAQAEVQTVASRVNEQIGSMDSEIKNVELAMNRLSSPSDSLADKMEKLRDAADDVILADGAQEKVNAWHRYQAVLADCNAELARMQKAEKLSYSDSQDTQLKALIKYEEKLRDAGLLTNEFKQRIEQLFDALSGASTKNGMTKFLDSFDKLKSDVGNFENQIKEIERLYKALADAEAEAVDLQIALSKIDAEAQPERYADTSANLDSVNQRRNDLQEQILDGRELLQYSTQIAQIDEKRADSLVRLLAAQASIADEAILIKNNIGSIETAVKNVEAKFKNLMSPSESLVANMKDLRSAFDAIGSADSDEKRIQAYERLVQLMSMCNTEITQIGQIERSDLNAEKFASQLEKASADLKTIERTWSAFKQDKGLSDEYRRLQESLKTIKHPTELKAWNAELSTFKANIKAAGLNMQSFGDVVKSNLAKVTQWASATSILYDALHIFKKALQEVKDIDYAMIDLRKTTNETDVAYSEFYHSANDTAKQLGITTKEVVAQTAEWSRLGYTMEQAAELSKNSAIFATISENMTAEYATDGLVSMLKAYNLDVNDTMDGIISKVNAVGNAYAVTNADIVESLTRSSSALAVANTSFEESIALATAGTEITRNAEGVGNALKSISMRIRGYDEETEEYSEDIAILTGAIADLTKTASNNYAGVSLFEKDDPTTYRSVYDILNDISLIWDEITDKEQAKLLDTLFGKHRAQVGASILDNFDQARNAMDTMANSAGSAEAEMENVTQSIEFQFNALKETWVGVAQNVFETEVVSGFISVLQVLSDVVQGVTNALGTFGTIGLAGLAAQMPKFKSTVGRPKLTGFITAPTYVLVATRNEFVA